jgi:alpha-galactosidase
VKFIRINQEKKYISEAEFSSISDSKNQQGGTMKKVFRSNDLKLIFGEESDRLPFYGVALGDDEIEMTRGNVMPPFQAAILGEGYGGSPALNMAYSSHSLGSVYKTCYEDDRKIELVYENTTLHTETKILYEKTPGANVLRCTTSIKNVGTEEIIISMLSSAYIPGICWDENLEELDNDRLRIHYCLNTWEGEGQWRTGTLNEMGVYYAATHANPTAVHFSNVGSTSTSKRLPMLVLEDTKKGICWYFQIETSSNWNIELGFRNEHESSQGCVYCTLDAANERYGFFTHRLKPGESYTSEPAAFGCCVGGFDDGIRELTRYRRSFIKPANPWQGESPVIFNDYMNALWANPTDDVLIPLIDKVSQVGVDGFCIDAGWFDKRADQWGANLGDWNPSDDRFGDKGLQGILDRIKAQHMIPGLWIEMEVVSKKSAIYMKPNEWFICRNGVRIMEGGRAFLDYRSPQVRQYMHGVFNRLISMGVGYFKNDYNGCVSIGDDKYESPGYSLQEHLRAFYRFVDELREKYPSLILENCSGGAMREDNGILSHFHLQSVSDQEDYRYMPSIVTGSLAGVLPEQLWIWCFPIPLRYQFRATPGVLEDPDYQTRMETGEQTIYNLVTGMAGNLYLSGRLEYASEKNIRLIKQGVTLYKSLRSLIHQGYPVWPCGFNRIEHHEGFDVLVIENEDRTDALLYVWRKRGAQSKIKIPLTRYRKKNLSIEMVFPTQSEYSTPFQYHPHTAIFEAQLKNEYSARLFRIRGTHHD